MLLHAFYHVDFEDLGTIDLWARDRNNPVTVTNLHAGETPPPPDRYDMLVVMGGPMNIYEEDAHPWLAMEKEAIRQAVAAAKPVLGVCLGAQLVADVLGGKTSRNPEREIGWWPVNLTPEAAKLPLLAGAPQTFKAFHWHGDVFEIPPGAVRLAESEGCPNQGFLYGDRVVGLQFHLETAPANLVRMIKNCGDEIDPTQKYEQSAKDMHALRPNFKIIKEINYQILDNVAAAFGK